MTADLAAALRALAASLPASTPVPVPAEALLEFLSGKAAAVPAPAIASADLTVADIARRFGRHPSTVRQWVERGEFPGAYKLQDREWRIPTAALDAFEANARQGRKVDRQGRGKAVDIAAWRSAS